MIDEKQMQKILAQVVDMPAAQDGQLGLVDAALAAFDAQVDELQRESEHQLLGLPYAVQVGYGPSMRKGYADARQAARPRIRQMVSEASQRGCALREAQDLRAAGRPPH